MARKHDEIHDADFDPAKLAEEAIEANLDPSIFDQIEEGDIRWPKNVIDWIRSKRFLNVTPFPRQVEICANFLGQFCPRCTDPALMEKDRWGGNLLLMPAVDYPLGEIWDRVSFLEDGVCPKCEATKLELINKGELTPYINLNGCAGMRSSKTVIVGGLVGTYQVVRFLQLKSPSQFFGLMANQTLHATFVAITAGQAQETLWDAFKDRVDSAPWFREYHAFLNEEAKRLGKDRFHNDKQTFLAYEHKQLIISFCGPDIRTIRGRTRFYCVTADTLVPTTDGWLRMGEIAKRRPPGPSEMLLTVLTDDGSALTSSFHCSGVAPTLRVQTQEGFEVSGTHDHPLQVLDRRGDRIWKRLEEIKPGDFLVLKKGGLFSQEPPLINLAPYATVGPHSKYEIPSRVDTDLAWLMGLLLAEGTVWHTSSQNGGVKWVTGDDEILERSLRIFEEKFGSPPPVENLDTMSRVVCQSPRVGRFFSDIGLAGNSYTKEIPAIIRKSPKAVVAAFLRGYFDGGGNSEPLTISVHSASTKILKEVQVLLLGFGIVSRRSSYTRDFRDGRGDCEYHLLRIFGYNLHLFHERIGFSLSRKQQEQKDRFCLDTIPVRDRSAIDDARVDGTHQKYRCVDGMVRRLAFSATDQFFEAPTRDRLSKLDLSALEFVDPALARNIRQLRDRDDLYFSLVKQVEDGNEEPVFDLSVPGPHCFVANGIVNHNTGIDEKGWFDVEADKSSASGKIRLNAHQTHEALIKSLRTIRSASMKLRESGFHDPPDALNSDVSSPSSLNDAIMVGLREANEDPTVYPFHYATWEMNPNVPLNSLRHEMRNKRDFERDYAAVPPLGASQFIDNQSAVEKCQGNEGQNRWISWTPRYITDEFGDRTMYLEVKVLKREKNRPRLLTVDTGLTNNSFAITLWSYDRDFQRPVCDIAIECMPEEKEGERILVNFPMMFEHAVVPLVKDFRVIMAAYDRWNSIDHVQRLRLDHKVEAIQYVLKWADFQAIRARLIDSSVRLPKMEMSIQDVRQSDKNFDDIVRNVPITHLVLQILTVREGGRKVIKPINGTDDLFRCLCLAVKFLLDPDYTKKFEQYGSGLGFGKASVGVCRSNRDQAVPQVRAGKRGNIGLRRGFTGKLT